jgi:hypothetical protein
VGTGSAFLHSPRQFIQAWRATDTGYKEMRDLAKTPEFKAMDLDQQGAAMEKVRADAEKRTARRLEEIGKNTKDTAKATTTTSKLLMPGAGEGQLMAAATARRAVVGRAVEVTSAGLELAGAAKMAVPKVASAAASVVGGVPGMVAIGGIAAVGWLKSVQEESSALVKEFGHGYDVLTEYNSAMGIATTSIKSIGDRAREAAGTLDKNLTKDQALRLNDFEVEAALAEGRKATEPMVTKMSKEEAASWLRTLPGITEKPQQLGEISLDLVQGLGKQAAQEVLNEVGREYPTSMGDYTTIARFAAEQRSSELNPFTRGFVSTAGETQQRIASSTMANISARYDLDTGKYGEDYAKIANRQENLKALGLITSDSGSKKAYISAMEEALGKEGGFGFDTTTSWGTSVGSGWDQKTPEERGKVVQGWIEERYDNVNKADQKMLERWYNLVGGDLSDLSKEADKAKQAGNIDYGMVREKLGASDNPLARSVSGIAEGQQNKDLMTYIQNSENPSIVYPMVRRLAGQAAGLDRDQARSGQFSTANWTQAAIQAGSGASMVSGSEAAQLQLAIKDLAMAMRQSQMATDTPGQRAVKLSERAAGLSQYTKGTKEYSDEQEGIAVEAEQNRVAFMGQLQSMYKQVKAFNRSIERSEYDYQESVTNSTNSFYRQRRYAYEDFAKQQGYAVKDFHRQMLWQQEDFNRSMERSIEDSAKTMYNPYERAQSKYTMGTTAFTVNIREQNEMLRKQQSDLQKLSAGGMSQDTINLLDLANPANSQQAGRMVLDMANDPTLIAELNKVVQERLAASSALTTGGYSESYNRAVEDFGRAAERSVTVFEEGQARSTEAFNTNLRRGADEFAISMGIMAKSHALMMSRASEDLATAYEEITLTQEELLAAITTDLQTNLSSSADAIVANLGKQAQALRDAAGAIDVYTTAAERAQALEERRLRGDETPVPAATGNTVPKRPPVPGSKPSWPGGAGGGTHPGDSPWIIGEKGPELFMPGVSGAIIPNNTLTGQIAREVVMAMHVGGLYAQPQGPSTTTIDASTNVNGPITVQAADTKEFLRSIEEQKRLKALRSPRSS